MAKKFNISDVIDIMMDSDGDSDDDFDGYIDEDELLRDEIDNDSEINSNDDDDDDDDDDDGGDGDDNGNVDKEQNGIDIQEVNWSSGCCNDMTNKTPLEFFELLVTDDIVDFIVDQTNLYATQFFEKESPPPRSRVNEWKKKPFTSIELMKFFAMVIVMGVIHYPRLDDYWVTSWPFSSNTFSQIMSRDWFSCILKFLHLNNSEMMPKKGETGYDALYKVRPMLEKLLQNFKCNYNLGRELSIDERMIGFKGRISFIQYMPKKPTKWGLKAYILADSTTGYTYSWILYTGKDSSLDTSCGSVIDATVFRLLTHEQFRINLSKDLLLKAGIYFNDIPTQRTSAPPASRLTERHFPSKIPEQGKQHQLDSNSKRMVTVVRYSPDERRTETLLFTAYSGKDIASRPTTIIESTL